MLLGNRRRFQQPANLLKQKADLPVVLLDLAGEASFEARNWRRRTKVPMMATFTGRRGNYAARLAASRRPAPQMRRAHMSASRRGAGRNPRAALWPAACTGTTARRRGTPAAGGGSPQPTLQCLTTREGPSAVRVRSCRAVVNEAEFVRVLRDTPQVVRTRRTPVRRSAEDGTALTGGRAMPFVRLVGCVPHVDL